MVRSLTKWTIQDYHCIVDSGVLADRQVELIDGEIVDMAPEGPLHASRAWALAELLRQQLAGVAAVRESYPVTLEGNSEPSPDIAIVKARADGYSSSHPKPEDIYLLVEISNSTVEYDLGTKAKLYSNSGIKEYWVVDLPNKQVWLHRKPARNRYLDVREVSSGQSLL